MKDKFIIITGASTGIGRAISVEFAKTGAITALIARRKDKLEETKLMVEKSGGKARIFVSDLSKVEEVNKLIKNLKENTDKIDALINVAGIWHGEKEVYADKNFEDFDQQVILDTLAVGTTAPTLLSHGLIPLMQKGSSIVNISGTFENGAKGWLPYYVSKKAIEDLTVGLSEELKDKGIRSNCISPSDTATEEYKKHFPQYLDDAINPQEIAKFIVDLCGEDRTETGKVFVLKKDTKPYEGFHS